MKKPTPLIHNDGLMITLDLPRFSLFDESSTGVSDWVKAVTEGIFSNCGDSCACVVICSTWANGARGWVLKGWRAYIGGWGREDFSLNRITQEEAMALTASFGNQLSYAQAKGFIPDYAKGYTELKYNNGF